MISGRVAAGLAGAAALGAWAAQPVPEVLVLVLAAAAVKLRRPTVWCLALGIICSFLAARSWDGIDRPLPATVSGRALVLTDPKEQGGAVRAEVRISGRRFDAWARGASAGRLMTAAAGETLRVDGRVSELRGRSVAHQRRRHLAGRLELSSAGSAGPGTPLARVANDIRRTVLRGAESMPEPARGLFGGFVLGDDRGQEAATVERFRAAGLSHLLVVSGQNVAFALALAAPLVTRGANGARLAWAAVVLVLFGTAVRWEPSVMRAVFMAGLAIGTRTLGGSADRMQVLSIAVAGLLLIDPLLVGSVSFLLSVGASAGIAVLTPWFAERIPGPRPVVDVLAATAGAQVGVAPVLVTVFGSLPLVSVPANLLAVPVAGPSMMWGMAAGVPAGLLGDRVAGLLHWPSRVMLGWIDRVAAWAAGLEAPVVDGRAAMAAAVVAGLLALVPRSRTLVLPGALAALIASTLVSASEPPARRVELAGDSELWRAGGATVLVLDGADPRVLADLSDARIRRVDLLVASRTGASVAGLVADVRAVVHPRRVIAPRSSGIPDAVAVPRPATARAGPISLTLQPVGNRLDVLVSVASDP